MRTNPESGAHTPSPATPEFLPATPKRGPGVRRLNKRPMAIAFTMLAIAMAGLGYSFIDRMDDSKPEAGTSTAGSDGNAAPVEKNALFAGVMPFGSIPDRTVKPGYPSVAPPPNASTSTGPVPASTAAPHGGQSMPGPSMANASERPAEDPIAQQLRQMALEQYKKSWQAREAATRATPEVAGAANASVSQTQQMATQGAAQGLQNYRQTASLTADGKPAIATAAGFGAGGAAGGGAGAAGGDTDQNRQAEKSAFLNAGGASTDYLGATRTAPLGEYEVKAGTVIPSILITGVNSDLPGQMIAQVQETVYSHVDAYMPLIPKGARIIGRYDSSVAMGQERVLVAWNRIIYPDGTSLNIGSMAGADEEGYSGFSDQVDNHYLRLFGHAAFLSVFSAGVQLSQPQQSGDSNGYTSQQIIAGSMGQQLGQLGMEITRRNMNIQPTLKIRPGYEFNIVVNKDIVLPPWDAKR